MRELQFAWKQTFPIFFTYVFIGIAFGIMMTEAGRWEAPVNSSLYLFLSIALIAGITVLTRSAPFLLFGRKRGIPAVIRYLGTVLPPAIMVIFVCYCLRNIKWTEPPHGLPELLSCLVVAAVHRLKNNMYLSIIAGTGCYMLLLRLL